MTFLEDSREHADLIWSGLAVHHLLRSQKERFFGRCGEILDPSGYLLLFDPVRREGEGRQEHCLRWRKLCECKWMALSTLEKRRIAEHVFLLGLS
ncbi:MAG: hypothetical protein HPY61_00870 [Methanotrichaceae archaeon]|nr:hypothetical protein [Methanotrichaceae archaeon]